MLTSLLQELPHLMNSMPPLLKTLAATNSTIRKVVHQHVQSITIFTPEDVVLLASANRPNMTSLDLGYDFLGNEVAWLTQECSRLTTFKFEMKNTRMHYSAIRHAVHSCVFPLLASSNWPRLCTLNLTWALLDAEAMAQLVLGYWPNLTKLVLSGNLLNTAAIKHLVKGKWPLLETLDLSRNKLDASSTEVLAQGLWPKLKSLNISQMGVGYWDKNYGAASLANVPGHLIQGDWPSLESLILIAVDIDAQGISVLIKGNWPLLKELSLCDNCFSLAWLLLLSQAAWPLVRKLSVTLFSDCHSSVFGYVYDPSFTADAISRLMTVDWQLEELLLPETTHLGSGCLPIRALQSLVKSDMKSLTTLDLTGHMLDVYSVGMLAESKWPQLVRVCLNTHILDANTAGFLVKADWPLLKHFAVTGITVSSMSVLCKASWPYLETLELTESMVTFGVQGAAELVKGDWLCLTSLNLCKCALDTAGMNLIVDMSNWPLLASLDISHYGVIELMCPSSYTSMLPVFKGRWPLLQRFRESDNMNYVG